MPIFVDKYKILVSNHKSDIIFAKEHNMKRIEINREDDSLDNVLLDIQQRIASNLAPTNIKDE